MSYVPDEMVERITDEMVEAAARVWCEEENWVWEAESGVPTPVQAASSSMRWAIAAALAVMPTITDSSPKHAGRVYCDRWDALVRFVHSKDSTGSPDPRVHPINCCPGPHWTIAKIAEVTP